MFQIDEIEALSSIYGSDLTVENEEDRCYSVTLRNDASGAQNSEIILQVCAISL